MNFSFQLKIRPEARRTNLLDERIDQYQSMDWTFRRGVVHHDLNVLDWGAAQYPVGDMR
jgi:hypothetical protein